MNDKQTLTLEAGKYYKTRDGRKAFVAGVVPGQTNCWPVMGWIIEDQKNTQVIWRLDGHDGGGEWRANDLVAEWVEPKRIKGWMNIYLGHDPLRVNKHSLASDALGGQIYPIREHADIANSTAKMERIACIEIDVLEGHSLNGEGA